MYDVLGGLLSILSAACFGLNNATVRRGVVTGSVLQGMIISVPAGVPIFFAGALVAGSLDAVVGFSPLALALLSAAGVIHFVFGRYCNYRALKAVGANLTGPVQQATLLVSLAGAMWVLDEYLTPLRIFGIGLTFLGPAVMLRGRNGGPAKPKSAATFRPKYAEGFSFALLSTFGYGSSPLLVRAVFEDGGWGVGASLSGGLVSYAAATIIMAAFIYNRRQLDHVLSMDRGAARWFVWSGINVCVAQVFRYMALAVAPVSVVAPIMQLQVVFRLIFGWSINREHEVFTVWMLVGTAISLLGAVALSVSTEFVIGLVALPDWIVAAARWRWP